MEYLEFGATGLRVSRLAVGTAAFGLDNYGICTPGDTAVCRDGAIQAIRCAADSGITLFDTAPGYGNSEALLGQALRGHRNCLVATKVPIPNDVATISPSDLAHAVNESLENSLRALQRDVLDIVQIHNATIPVLQRGDMLLCLERAREVGKLRAIGVSVYGEETAWSAVHGGRVQVLQVAVNLLDQRMRARVLVEAESTGVGVLVRSALLKGALTSRAQWLPKSLQQLSQASEAAVKALDCTWESLPAIALRFCLSLKGVHSVLVGIRNDTELRDSLAALRAGPLEPRLLHRASTLALDDDRLLNPTHWQLEEIDIQHAQR